MPRGRSCRGDVPATCRVEFRLTPGEMEELRRRSCRSGLSIAEYCRLATILLEDEFESAVQRDSADVQLPAVGPRA